MRVYSAPSTRVDLILLLAQLGLSSGMLGEFPGSDDLNQQTMVRSRIPDCLRRPFRNEVVALGGVLNVQVLCGQIEPLAR